MAFTDDKEAIKMELAARSLELVSSVLGKPTSITSREYRFKSGQSFVLHRSGKNYGFYYSHSASSGGDMLQFITDYIIGGGLLEAMRWAKDWLGWNDGKSSMPMRKEAARRLEQAKADADRRSAKAADDARRISDVRWRWDTCKPIAGTPAEIYLAGRRILPANIPDNIRWSKALQAIVFAVTCESGVCGLQYVRLTKSGEQDKSREPVKTSFGPISLGSVRFPGDPTKPVCYAEGPETGMSVWLATSYETHVMLGVDGFKRIVNMADKSRRVILCRDDDPVIAGAYKAAVKAVSELRAGGFDVREAWPFDVRRQSGEDFNDVKSPVEIRRRIAIANYDAPVIPRIETSIDTARKRIDGHVADFFEQAAAWNNSGKPPVIFLKITVGGGKTEAAIRHTVAHIKRLRETGDMRPVVYLLPEHRLADEIAQRVRQAAREAGVDCVVDVYRGRTAKNPNGTEPDERMCQKHELVAEAERLAVKADKEICPKCPFKDSCAYLAQKGRTADVWIASHYFAFHDLVNPMGALTERNEAGEITRSGAAACIIDESVVQAGLIGTEGRGIVVPLDLLADPGVPIPKGDAIHGIGARLAENRTKLAEALRALPEGPVPKAALRACGFSSDSGRDMAKAEWSRIVTSGPWRERVENRTIKPLAALWRAIEESLSSDGELCGWLTICRTDEGALAVRITGRRKVSKAMRTPTLVIDAKADERLLRPFWPHGEFKVPIKVSAPHQRIRQMATKSFAKSWLTPPKDGDKARTKARAKALRNLRAIIIREALSGGKTAVISNKAVIAELRLPKQIETLWFNATAGRDHMRDVDRLIVVGRPAATPSNIEPMAAALTGRPPEQSLGKGWYSKADASRRIKQPDGETEIPASVDRHPDETCEALRALITGGEIEQAIGRARGTSRTSDRAVEVIVLSNVVLDWAVDELLTDEWLSPSCDDLQIAEGGIAFTDGTMMARAYPQIWKTAGSARNDRYREPSSVTNSYRVFPYENVTLFQLPGQSAKPQTAVFIPGLLENPRAAIEAIVGNLAAFEIVVAAAVPLPLAVGAEDISLPGSQPVADRIGDPIAQYAPSEGSPDEALPDAVIQELSDDAFVTVRRADGSLWVQSRTGPPPPAAGNDDGLRLTMPEPPAPVRAKRAKRRASETRGLDLSWLDAALADSGRTRSEFARDAGLSPSHLRNIETGHRTATPEQIEAIYRAADGLHRKQARLL